MENHPTVNKLYQHFAQYLLPALGEIGHETSLEELTTQMTQPPQFAMGHVAFPCFGLAKTLKKAPPQIAKELTEHIAKSDDFSLKPAGPYLNITYQPHFFTDEIESMLRGPFFNRIDESQSSKVMIEYFQPNTHKEVHVGHARNLCLGNALVEMNRFTKRPTLAVTYPGDVGTHVAKVLWYLKFHYQGEMPQVERGAWLGQMYARANTLLEEQRGSENEEENREQLTGILKQLEHGSGEYYDLWKETRAWSIDLMEKVCQWADVQFDRWFFESEVDSPSLKFSQELYKSGKLIKDQGAIGMDLSAESLGFCILIKSDGTGLYATKDLELARRKFEEFGIQKSIYVVDNRQSHHFKQVFKVLEKIGFEQAKDCLHLQYDVVELPDGAMSSRKGNVVTFMDLVEKMQSTIADQFLAKYKDEWSEEKRHKTAQIIANGAIKYGMLRVDNNRKIIFDMDEWLKLDGETGPYLQYVCARIRTMCEKLNFNPQNNFSTEKLQTPQELLLMRELCLFNTVVKQSTDQSKSMHLCSYLYNLGKAFNSFYAECPIGKAEDEELKKARLALSYATDRVMENGLKLLGIQVPEKM